MDIMVGLGPVMTDEHFPHQQPPRHDRIEPEATSSPLMVQCSRHVIPPAIQANLTNWQAHDLVVELKTLRPPVLTCQRLGTSLTQSVAEVVDPH
ncbi:MAG TPA: hypothetical protein VE990_19385 [Acidimicrobiales bacterium]|nr:hypothetical protein [Acidimicrobiales bacterium]